MKFFNYYFLVLCFTTSISFAAGPILTAENMHLIANTTEEELFQKLLKDKNLASARLKEFLVELGSIEKQAELNRKVKFCVKVGFVKECEIVEKVSCFRAMNSAINTLGVVCNG